MHLKITAKGIVSFSVVAIPIIVYHNVAESSEGKLTISSNLLEKEIKYLYDNNFNNNVGFKI
jgi:hypothetical protein